MTEEDRRRERCKRCNHRIRMTETGYGCEKSYYQDPISIEVCPVKMCDYPNCGAKTVSAAEEWCEEECGKVFSCYGHSPNRTVDCLHLRVQLAFQF